MGIALKERDVLRQILDYLAARHIFAFRLSTGAFFDGKRAFKAHSLGAGTADIMAHPKGSPTLIWIEVKAPKGRQSPLQKAFQQIVEAEGDRYVVARSIDDLKAVGL